ncbi:MAG: polysaccharide deacetylase family protein [Bacteroidetes bacterium]|nr:polysaccharide deacetylase family protein [Bacteroidota bacterium]
MNKIPRFVSKQIGRLLSEQTLFKTISPIFLPFYHVVSNQKLPYRLNYPYQNSIQFEKELDYYLKHFKAVPLEYLIENPHSNKKVFHISFDDGLRECADVIAPILLKKGIPATFFVNSGFTDNRVLFHRYKASLILSELMTEPNSKAELLLKNNGLNRENILQADITKVDVLDETADILGINFNEFLKNKNPYLTSKQISKLKEQGFTIGAHSENHPEFWQISEEEQLSEIKQSMTWVVEKFNPTIKTFSFPFTDSGVSLNLLQKLKSQNICDLTFGTAGLKYDECETHFQRYPAEQKGDFKLNLKTEWVYYLLRKTIGKATVKH